MNINNEKPNLNLYEIFYSSKSIKKGKHHYNDILKGTKSVLKNQLSYSNYIKGYNEFTTIQSFKIPSIKHYPLLNKKSLELIPLCKSTRNIKARKKLIFKNNKNKLIFGYDDMPYTDKKNKKFNLQKQLKINLSDLKEKNKKNNKKNKDNYEMSNPIISDFFYKWTQKYSDDIKNPKINNFSSLSYDEKKIFYDDYDSFMKDKIEYIKKNKITNLQENLESEFYDVKDRKIKIDLLSMKLIFRPINEKNLASGTEKVINLPLSFVFLFYIDGFNFFKKILICSIHFSNNFISISFSDKNIYSLIKKIFKNEKDYNSFLNIRKNNKNKLNKEDLFDPSEFKIKRSMTSVKIKRNETKKSTKKIENPIDKSENDKKIKNIHADKEKQRKEDELNNKKYKNKIKESSYDEFEFIWETPVRTYRVILQLPTIQLWCEHLNRAIITFCDKNLFLFMFKNNFINWDFYALHYFFSIKSFRKLIIKKYSLEVRPLLKTLYNNYKNKSHNYEDDYLYNKIDIKLSSSNFNTTLYTREKKINNLLNDKNESFIFFYTDNFNTNSIIDFHSYSILVNYNKLNPYKSWKFFLNFQQMKFLTQINKFELLECFIPKILKTNFEYGSLEMDFSVFEDFNSNILNYPKKEIINKYIFNEKDQQNQIKDKMKLEIIKPYITIEKNVDITNLSNISEKIELTSNILSQFSKAKNSYLFTKIILKVIDKKDKEKFFDEKDEFDSTEKRNNNLKYDIDKVFEMNRKGKVLRYSRSLHFKKKGLLKGMKQN